MGEGPRDFRRDWRRRFVYFMYGGVRCEAFRKFDSNFDDLKVEMVVTLRRVSYIVVETRGSSLRVATPSKLSGIGSVIFI